VPHSKTTIHKKKNSFVHKDEACASPSNTKLKRKKSVLSTRVRHAPYKLKNI